MSKLKTQYDLDALRDAVIRRMVEMPPKHKPKTTNRQDTRKIQISGSSDVKKGSQG